MSVKENERYARDRVRIRARQLEYAKRNRERNRLRELARSGTWRTWQGMKQRCLNPNKSNFKYYGGRGISVCERWRDNFEAFRADMGDKPEGLTLDRINPNGNYEPGNCRWATMLEQRHNRRDSA